MLSVAAASEMLKKADDILIICHAHPDGDTLGSGFALCRALLKSGKRARVHCEDRIPRMFAYLGEGIETKDFDEKFIVAVDVASLKLLGKSTEEKYADKIDLCIDHHGSNTLYAKNTLLDEHAPAASELMFRLLTHAGIEIDNDIADCLYTGICTDTGCFRYADVTPETHRVSAELMERGARAAKINVWMFETKTRNHLQLERLSLEGMEFYFEGKCAFITITQKMFEETGTGEEDCDAICALPRQVEGVLAGVTLREKKDGSYKASVRTHDPVNAAEICRRLGGGGHANAAGCQFSGTLEEAKKELLAIIGEAVSA